MNPILFRTLTLLISIASILTVNAQPKEKEEDLRVDPMAELHRSATFIDSTELPLASAAQIAALRAESPASGYFCFAELREREIRRYDTLPVIWATRPAAERTRLNASAQPGEYYPWQLGVWAAEKPLRNVKLLFEELTNEQGDKIPATAMQCFTLGGVSQTGKTFTKRIDIPQGSLQMFWSGIDIPKSASGTYRGRALLTAENGEQTPIEIALRLSGEPLENGGTDQGWRKSRMQWLNSRIGFDQTTPTKPYTPLLFSQGTLSYLGGEVALTKEGLPASITTRYDRSNQLDSTVANAVLARPVRFIVETAQGEERLTPSKFRLLKQTPALVEWEVLLKGKNVEVACIASMQFDGLMHYRMQVTARKEIEIKDIRAQFDYTPYASKYRMGLGKKGGVRTSEPLHWKWDTIRQQDKIWMGNINAGMNLLFKDDNYRRPLVNIYYHFGRLRYPHSWGNDGKGGIELSETGDATRVSAYSGPRAMQKGELLSFNFDLMITPVKPIEMKHHFEERGYHLNADTSAGFIPNALKAGAKAINVHHKADIYPYINYPMVDEAVPDMKRFIANAHANDLMVRLYYTCRELTVKTPEFWMLRSLGNEIVLDGPGNDARTIVYPNGPKPWLKHNLRTHYLPAWYAGFNHGKYKGQLDIAVITTPESRWSNYYLEGLNWMIKNEGLDGIYVDDSSLDAEMMQRARRIFDADGKRRTVDMHTWNHMNTHAGYANSVHLYLDVLPFVDRLWIGELFYDTNERDFWLVEMSGIPFGLMSETLQAYNQYRAMVFGMWPRLPWSGNPVPMWRLHDRFGISTSKMYGYWDERNPVRSSNEQIPVTTYLHPGQSALVVMANWDNDATQSCTLTVDPAKLGFTPTKVSLPQIDNLQQAASIDLNGTITLPKTDGRIFLLEK